MKRKISNCSARLGWMVILTIVGILFVFSCEQTTGPEDGTTEVTKKLIVYTDTPSIVATKGSANITVKVYSDEDTTKTVSGVRVTFSADTLITIQTINDVTDAYGIARAKVYAGKTEGTVKITAAIDDFSNAAFIQITPDQGLIESNLNLNLSSSPSILAANGTDVSEIKAQLYDTDKNPIKGEKIYFTTTLGIILESAVTDDWGIATVNLRSERTNGIAEVTARYNKIIKTTKVEFSGAIVAHQASPTILVADNKSRAVLTISLVDASGSPVVEGIVNLSTNMGTLYSANGISSGTAIVDSSSTQGKVTAYLSSNTAGKAIVQVSALGTLDSLTVNFTDYTFSLSASSTEIFAGGATTQITAALRDSKGSLEPIELDNIEFSTNLGTITKRQKNINGTVTADLISGSSKGTATVTAEIKDPPVSASTTVNFIAATVDSITIRSDKLSVRFGRDETVDIRATVFDITGNPKSGVSVTFSLLKGPGGGEELVPGTAVTNDRGEAVVAFTPGNKGSVLEGVEIQARIGDILSNIIRLTIAGEPNSVVVGFNTDTFSSNTNGTYGIGVSAIVSDVNRNKVADGTVVNFSLKGDVGVIADQVSTSDGVAATTLTYSPSDAGKEVTVTASSGGIQDTKTVILPGQEGTLATLNVSPKVSSVVADGESNVTLSIFLADTNGQPLSNRTVYCSTDIGTIQPSAITGDPSNADAAPGKATIRYTSMASWEDRVANVKVISGVIEEYVVINLKGITLDITADPEELPSDGQTKSIINVLVKETTSHIPLTSKEVNFGASDGFIEGSKFTDGSGVARSTFTAGYNPGIAYIFVSFGSTLVDSLTVNINEVVARGIELFASPSQIPANGISTSVITALLRDDNFNPVVGENIIFSTDIGTITAADSTDENGRAEATLVSERKNGEAMVTAKYKKHIETIPVSFTGVKISVSATPENLFAGGDEETNVTAYVKDAAEVPIVGTDVKFVWYLEDVLIGEKVAKSDVQGRASIPISSSEAGRAKIVINGAGAVDSTYVTFTRLQFSIDSEEASIPTGGKELIIWAQLYDTVEEKYVDNANVEFFTTLGTITSNTTTNTDGKAFATLTSGNTAGIVTVSASTKYGEYRVSAEKKFTFINAAPDSVNLKVDANIVAVGGGNSELIAIVTDEFGNPVPDALVSFKVLQGPAGGEFIHPAIVTTGPSGIASTYFYSGQVQSEFESVFIQAMIGTVTSNIVTLTIAGAPETVRPGYQTEWDIDGIDNGDGTFSLPISALILDANSNGVVDGTTVYFKVDPPEGAAISPVKTVNSVAASTITYPSASAGKEITLTASAGGKEGSISFTLPGFVVSYIAVSASPKTIPADGKSTSIIKATIFDKNGSSSNVPDGTTVSFLTEGGTLDPVITKTVKGIATTTLTSDKNDNRYVMITAQSGVLEDFTWIWFEEVGASVNQVANIELEVDKRTIKADGVDSANITATIKTFDDQIVTIPTNITFETDIGDITTYKQSNEEGKAVAQLTSGIVGTATITAKVGNASSTTTIVVVPGDPRSVDLSFEPTSVGVVGSGRNETLLMTAHVKDNKNNPVGDGNLVKFELVGAYDTTASISPEGVTNYESDPVPTVNGAATVSFHSGNVAGTVRVKATVVNANGNPTNPLVTSETTQFLVHSGPAFLDMRNPSDPFTDSRITVGTGPTNIFAGEIGGDNNKANIVVIVTDRYKNPVPKGTAVYFTTTGGSITTSTGYTNEDGLASVTLYAANPYPTRQNSNIIGNPNSSKGGPLFFDMPLADFDGNGQENDGIAVVTAYTEGVDHNGDEVTVWNYAPIVFSLAVDTFDVDAGASILYRGQSTVITITIHDINGNPVMGKSEMTIKSSLGTLSNSSITTGSPGKTRYTVTLTNNLDPLNDTSADTVVSVTLTSPNGNLTASSIPIYMSISQLSSSKE
ncbi:MAG: Ig-like domain-containing protein [Candidatus Latescibacteria bacterium]|nr:Ig-like domain-containing protein [Candidatus Latescibacterota bacterium]